MPTKDELFEKFEATGEAKVRERIIAEHYGGRAADLRLFAEEWLRLKEQARKGVALAQQMRIARSAKNAAWAAAIAAIVAAICAMIQFSPSPPGSRLGFLLFGRARILPLAQRISTPTRASTTALGFKSPGENVID